MASGRNAIMRRSTSLNAKGANLISDGSMT